MYEKPSFKKQERQELETLISRLQEIDPDTYDHDIVATWGLLWDLLERISDATAGTSDGDLMLDIRANLLRVDIGQHKQEIENHDVLMKNTCDNLAKLRKAA